MKSHHSLFDIMVEKLAETDAAVLVHDGDKSKAVRLPKSQIEIEPAEVGGLFILTTPEWLLVERGLV